MNEEDLYNLPIAIEDAASMLRRNISKNEKPYSAEAIRFNNRMVDSWKKLVLSRIADSNGTVRSGIVADSWMAFEEGHTIQKFIELKKDGLLQDYDMKVVEYWRDFFHDLTVEEMKEYGWGIVARGWSYLLSYIQEYYTIQKWERLYSKDTDPYYWQVNYCTISDLAKGKNHPYWDEETLKNIQQKVESILSHPVRPSM